MRKTSTATSIIARTSRPIPTTTPMLIAVTPSRVAGATCGMFDVRTEDVGVLATDIALGCGAIRHRK